MKIEPSLSLSSRIVIAAVLLAPAAANAQTAQEPAEESAKSQDDIIVTANRRSVGLQELPAAVTAVSGQRIEQIGARAKDDIAHVSPGVSFTDTGAGRQKFTIRGVQALSGEATTALYIDEIPVPRGVEAEFDIRLFDIDRVEILRGPQGTLFGASSMGGAIRVITNKPNLNTSEVNFDARVSSTNQGGVGFDLNAAVNIPIIRDKLALRVVGFRERVAGFVDTRQLTIDAAGDPVVGGILQKNAGDRDLYGVRASLKFQPIEDLSFTGTYYLQDSRFTGVSGEDVDPADPTAGLVEGALLQSRAFIERPGNNSSLGNLTIEYGGDSFSLISSTSYARARDTAQEDFTRRFGAAFGLPALDIFQNAKGEEFTQEARVLSQGDRRFNWLAGVFYTNSTQRAVQELRDLSDPAFPAIFTFIASAPNREISVFGEISYKLTDRLIASGGARRYSVTRKFSDLTLAGPLSGPDDDLSSGVATLNGWTYKGLLSFQANNDHLIYATVASGYRPGGPNSTFPTAAGPVTPPPFTPDKVTNFEIGWKSAWFDDRLTLNTAVYYLLWNRIQIPVSDPSGDFTFTGNGGKTHTIGIELELQAQPTKGLVLNATLGALRARFDNDVPGLDVRKGDNIPNVPEVTASFGASYQGELTSTLDFYANGLYSYTGPSTTNITRGPSGFIMSGDQLGKYSLVNLEAGFKTGPIRIGIYARNIGDSRGLIGRRRSGTFGAETRQYVQPRTIGIALRTDF